MNTSNISRNAEMASVDTNAAKGAQASYTNEIDTPAFALNIQNQVANLSMLQAHVSKKAATDKLGELKDKQKEQRELLAALATLKNFKGHNVDRCNISDMEKFLAKHGISLTYHTEKSHFSMNWRFAPGDTSFFENTPHREYCRNEDTDINIRALNSVQEQVASQVQSAMTQLQDFMGQYQSYLDGSRTASAKANEITLKLATTR